MIYLTVALFFITGAVGQIARNGTCNFSNILAIRDLNLTELSGDWYQVRRIPNTIEYGTCSTTNITTDLTNTNAPSIAIHNREVDNGKLKYRNGTINLQNGNYGPLGQFAITYEDAVYDSILLASNYKSYALLYSCMNINNVTKNVWSWVLSRNTTLTKKDEDLVKTFVDSYEDLRNVTWTTPEHTKEACRVNSSITYGLSSVLATFALLISGKGIVSSEL